MAYIILLSEPLVLRALLHRSLSKGTLNKNTNCRFRSRTRIATPVSWQITNSPELDG